MASITREQPFDHDATGIALGGRVRIEDEFFAVVLMSGPPTNSLGMLGAGEDVDAEEGVHHRLGRIREVMRSWAMTQTCPSGARTW